MNKINEIELHELFDGLKNGKNNTNSFNCLYENYYSLVYGIVFSMLKNKENSEDVSQTIFSKIYQLPKEKLPDSYEASWLYKVSKNETLQYIRKYKNEASFEEIYDVSDVSDTNNNIDDIIDIETYKSMISGLTEKEKEIVSLKVLSQFTFKKIGQMLNMPTPTVQWSYYKAVNSLRISISSLAGFVLTFIIGIVTTKNSKYSIFKSSKKQKVENVKEMEQKSYDGSTVNVEQPDSIISNYENVNKGTSYTNQITSIENDIQAQDTHEETSKDDNFVKENVLSIGIFSISIVFLIIFIIFFKKHQQKRKNKASK